MKRHLFSASFGSYSFRKKITPWCILALPMIFTVWLKYYPILSAFYISLFQYDPIQSPGTFVGLSNYVSMFIGKRGKIRLSSCCCSWPCAFLSP